MKRPHSHNHLYLFFILLAITVTIIILAGCAGRVPEESEWFFIDDRAIIYFLADPHPVDTISVALPDGESGLYLWANGFLDKDRRYHMRLSIDSWGYEIEKRYRYEPQDIACSINGAQMKVVRAYPWKNPIGKYGARVELVGPVIAPHMPDTTVASGSTLSDHEIIINLTGFVYFEDIPLTIKAIKAIQKRPLPVR